MADKKCKACGATYHEGEDFYKCNKCGDIYCHDCTSNYSDKEKEISESAKNGDKERYVRAVCPSCETEMYRF